MLPLLLTLLMGAQTSTTAQAGGVTRIRFARGTTGATVQGWVGVNQSVDFVIRAGVGQYLSVALVTLLHDVPPAGVYLVVTDASGYRYQPLEWYQSAWTGTLPRTTDYYLKVVSTGGSGDFRLKVSIPAQIRFARGASSATLNGVVSPTQMVNYYFDARARQIISLTVVSPYNNVRLTLNGNDGTPLLRAAAMPSNTWTGVLPATQRYHLAVQQLSGAQATGYTLYISIVG
jgi:hypothetical protein